MLLLLVLVSAGLGGCARRGTEFQSAWDKAELAAGTWAVGAERESLRRSYAERQSPQDELWVRAGVTIRQEGRRGRQFFTARAMYRRPDSLRFQASRVPLGTLFEVVVRGDSAVVLVPRQGMAFVGTPEELSERLEGAGGIEPRDLVSAVLVLGGLQRLLDGPNPVAVVPRDAQHLAVVARDATSGWQYFWLVRRADGLVREVLVRDPGGAEQLRVRYDAYQLEPNAATGGRDPMPAKFELRLARHGSRVNVDVEQYRLGLPLPPIAFEVPPMREVYPMTSLVLEEGS